MPHKLVVHVLRNIGVAAEILEAVSETIKHKAGVITDGIVDQAIGAAARLLGLYAQRIGLKVRKKPDQPAFRSPRAIYFFSGTISIQ